MQNLVSEEALFPSNIINKPNKKKSKEIWREKSKRSGAGLTILK
jgi:hypothetical protein